MNMNHADTPAVKSAGRTLDVLEYIAGAPTPPVFAEIGDALQIPRSSLFYLLATLTQRGYIVAGEGPGGYTLGPSTAILAGAVTSDALLTRIKAIAEMVGSALNETTSYMERRGDELECRYSRLGDRPLLAIHRVGQRAPLYALSGGKILLADMEEAALDAYFARTALIPITAKTQTSEERLRDELQKVRRSGFGVAREERTDGVSAISVGLRVRGQLIGTLGAAMASVRFTGESIASVKKVLQTAAEQFPSFDGVSP